LVGKEPLDKNLTPASKWGKRNSNAGPGL